MGTQGGFASDYFFLKMLGYENPTIWDYLKVQGIILGVIILGFLLWVVWHEWRNRRK